MPSAQAKHWSFTLFEENAPDFDGESMLYLCYQREAAPETGRLHWQGYAAFKTKRTLVRVKELLGSGSIHLEVARGTPEDNRRYCSKESTGVVGTFCEFGELPGGKGERNDLRRFVAAVEANPQLDAFSEFPEIQAKYPRFVTDLRHRIRRKQFEQSSQEFVPNCQWQIELVQSLAVNPDRRTVFWFVDAVGGAGKSYFCRHYKDAEGHRGYIINGGKHADIYYGYEYQRVVFFDWSRDHQEQFPYGVVENFKNGYFLSTKYEVRTVYFDIPHVVVFSNFDPDYFKLSEDRWIIKRLS